MVAPQIPAASGDFNSLIARAGEARENAQRPTGAGLTARQEQVDCALTLNRPSQGPGGVALLRRQLFCATPLFEGEGRKLTTFCGIL
jgi:hypothetical protein